MVRLDEALIRRSFDASTFARGSEYFRANRVSDVHVDSEGSVRSQVRGTHIYFQAFEVIETGRGIHVDGECTCPVGHGCKHIVAVLLDLAERPPKADDYREMTTLPLDPAVDAWLKSVEKRLVSEEEYPPTVAQRLLYILRRRPTVSGPSIVLELGAVRLLKEGGYGPKVTRVSTSPIYSGSWPKYVLPTDAKLIGDLFRNLSRDYHSDASFRLDGPEAARLLPRIAATGRLVWEEPNAAPLKLANPRSARIHWVERKDGSQAVAMDAGGPIVIPSTPPWFVDEERAECGPLDTGVSDDLIEVILKAPVVRPEHASRVHEELARLLPGKPELLPLPHRPPILRRVDPVPHLTLWRIPARFETMSRTWRTSGRPNQEYNLPIARLEFEYDGVRVRGPGEEIRVREGEDVIVMPRQRAAEAAAPGELFRLGWTSPQRAVSWRFGPGNDDNLVIASMDPDDLHLAWRRYYEFLRHEVPRLRAEGWQIEGDLEVPDAETIEWRVDVLDEGNDWFNLDLGVVIDGERVDLRPILVDAIRTLSRSTGRLADVDDRMDVYHELPNGKVLILPAARLKPLLGALGELFGDLDQWGDLRLPAARAGETALLEDAASSGLQWQPPERLRDLRKRFQEFERISPVPTPSSLNGELRPYQSEGLAWLQFLRTHGFGGVLADDMGLGKTIQTLAHIVAEQEAGRLDRPVLIVAPTSTLPNWRREVAKFAPTLRLLTLHGSARKERFAEIDGHDLVVTSYPLLMRDREALKAHQFHLVVLDEAQNIKNPTAAVTHAAAELNARHRLCLSGTPVENNLDELWSLFHFLMPGFLGNLASFRKAFRTPIEQKGDAKARERLSRRVRPFVLRRTKEQVATELPPKTEVVERVELAGSQRDLYESLRLAMDRRVRELIESKGFQKSRIEILDALLKLRQVCCDPRLVKLDAAKKTQGSAKLERLMEMLDELRGEGRRILLFSQFTSMLDLIEEELRKADMEWVRISGDTEDRDTPVQRFQAGEVPLFLISLRAGGTGLNLTAADTVIHYDPWWNPAVENQATDRAHRIGQDKSVFVFKLVAEGTVEEKILELQQKKAALAGAIFGDGEAATALTAEDLRWVLAE